MIHTKPRQKPRPRGTRQQRKRVLALHAQGFNLREISARSRLHPKAVLRVLKLHKRQLREQRQQATRKES